MVSEPFNEDDRAGGRGQPPGGGQAVRARAPRRHRAYSPSCGVRTLGALRLSRSWRAAAASPSAVSASASITSGTGAPAITARISSPTSFPVPRPGPMTTALHLAVASRNASAQPSCGQRHADRLDRPRRLGVPGRAEPDHARARRHGAAGAEHGRALHPGRAGRHADGGRPLVACRGRAGNDAAMSASSTSRAAGVGNPMPMSATSTLPLSRGPVALEEAGLEGGERHRAVGPHARRPAPRRVSASTPEGMSTASTAAPGRRGRLVAPRKPVP